jgi:hypothetical protein
MTMQEDYRRHAEECVRSAATCQSEENRAVLLLASTQWRRRARAPSGIAVNAAERRPFN